jgi:GMP synthase PP-ATPase subunit
VIVLRALQAAQESAYTARLPFDLLERATQRILSSVPGVQRVIYDLTPSMHYSEQE